MIVGAALLDLVKHKDALQTSSDWMILAVGTVVSFIVALLCIRLMVVGLQKDFMIFAWLRIITGVVVLIAFFGFGYQIQG